MKRVASKGVEWTVFADGSIAVPARCTLYRTKKGCTRAITFEGGVIRPHKGSHGYLQVDTRFHGRKIRELVHRLVAMAYVPGFAEGLTVNHIDGNKLNNLPANLEWVSRASNTSHQWAIGLVNLRGENNPNARLTDADVAEIRRIPFEPAAVTAARFGVSVSCIYKTRQGKRRK